MLFKIILGLYIMIYNNTAKNKNQIIDNRNKNYKKNIMSMFV